MNKYLRHSLSLLKKGSPFYLFREIAKDALGLRNNMYSNEKHIGEAINWIVEAQKPNNDGGVAALYSLYDGWHESYSETTGYIIPTMFNYFHKTGKIIIKKSAIWMADWELGKQMQNGAFPGGALNGKEFPIVFNTGQVVFGMARAFRETNDEKYKKSAIKAADWLVKIQSNNGCWDKFDYLGKIHTYNTRTAWALLEAYELTDNKKYLNAANKNIDWAIKQQITNGWFKNNAFYDAQEPLLHTIAYTIQGILEVGIRTGNEKYIEAAKKPSDVLLKSIRKNGSIAGSFNNNWKSSVNWSCLTGNAQMSIIWLRLGEFEKEGKYLESAKIANNFLKSTQDLSSKNKGIRGGIKGAYPTYGWYAPFCYINWAAKFFIDALMLEEDPKLKDKMS